MSIQFNHIGIPLDHTMPGMIHHPEGHFWESEDDGNPFSIEFLHFDKEADYPEEHMKYPHVCFEVDDMAPYLEYADYIFLGPVQNVPKTHWAVFFRMKNFPLNIELYCTKKPDLGPAE